MYDINTYYVSAHDAYRALDTAVRTSDTAYAVYSRNSMNIVKEKFGLTPFREIMEHTLERVLDYARARGVSA
jgi:hypothetical protein